MHNINYTLEDTNKMSYEEFGSLVDTLHKKISDYLKDTGTTIDVVSPVLRSGGVLGSMLAVKLRITQMLPIQFKYFYHPVDVQQMISLPDVLHEVPPNPTILICEGNTSSGSTAGHVVKLIKQHYPGAKILYATVTLVHLERPVEIDGVDVLFYGTMTNENFAVGDDEAVRLGLRKGITIFPWENAQDEIDDINSFYSS